MNLNKLTRREFLVLPCQNQPSVAFFIEKGVLKNFGKFTENCLFQNLFLIKLQAKNIYFYRTPLVAASEHLQKMGYIKKRS